MLYVPLNATAFVVDLHYYGSPDSTSASLGPKAEAPKERMQDGCLRRRRGRSDKYKQIYMGKNERTPT